MRTHTYVGTRLYGNINNNNINNININNNTIKEETHTFCKEGVGEKLLLSYPDQNGTSEEQVSIPYAEEKTADASVLADARTYAAKTEIEPYEVWEKRTQNFVDYWNEQTKKNYRVTKDLVDVFKETRKKY